MIRTPRLAHIAALCLALLVGAPIIAQPNAPGPPTVPAKALVPNDDAREMFDFLETNPLRGEDLESMAPADAAPMDAVVEQTLARGERVPNWESAGVNLHEVLRNRPGGVAGNILGASTQFGVDQISFQDQPIEAVVPPRSVLVARYGAPFAAENVEIEITAIAPKLIVVERIGYRRVGTAQCRERSEARIYARPDIAATELDSIVLMMTLRTLPTLNRRGVCHVLEEREPGLYLARYFDREGYRLSVLETGLQPLRISPRTPSHNQSSPR